VLFLLGYLIFIIIIEKYIVIYVFNGKSDLEAGETNICFSYSSVTNNYTICLLLALRVGVEFLIKI
jgi:hypothetical protein